MSDQLQVPATNLHVAAVRVFASQSSYGSPFEAPDGSPLSIESGDVRLQIYLGSPPAWLCLAIGRRRALASAKMRSLFHGETIDFNASWNAAPDSIVDSEKYSTSVTVILSTTRQVHVDFSAASPWWNMLSPDSFLQWIQEAKDRFEPQLNLVERVLPRFLLNAMTDTVLSTRILFSPNSSFEDAWSWPDQRTASMKGNCVAQIGVAAAQFADPALRGSLANCLRVTVLPSDPARARRLEEALRTGKLRDRAGLLVKEEVLRDIQLEQVLCDVDPLAVVYVDMNGLKTINDQSGHPAGDRAIDLFQSALLKHAERGAVYRDGGDEFVLLYRLDRETSIDHARTLLQYVANTTGLSASVGIAFCGDPAEDPEVLKERADAAMYKAKVASKEEERNKRGRPSALYVEGGEVEFFRPSDMLNV